MKQQSIILRCSDQEKEIIRKNAKKNGMSISEYVRCVCIKSHKIIVKVELSEIN